MNVIPIEGEAEPIGNIGNYYGQLSIKTENGKFYWGIEDWDGTSWEEIPEDLYLTLRRYEEGL